MVNVNSKIKGGFLLIDQHGNTVRIGRSEEWDNLGELVDEMRNRKELYDRIWQCDTKGQVIDLVRKFLRGEYEDPEVER